MFVVQTRRGNIIWKRHRREKKGTRKERELEEKNSWGIQKQQRCKEVCRPTATEKMKTNFTQKSTVEIIATDTGETLIKILNVSDYVM